MSRKNSNLLDYGLEEEIDPKIKFNSLISVAVSTIMCLAARCPLPKSNVETTKLFLSTITDDNGEIPRNVRGFLSLLNNYDGPYECESYKERRFDKSSLEKKSSIETVPVVKGPDPQVSSKESNPSSEVPILTKRISKMVVKKAEKEISKKGSKNTGSKITPSKSIISNKL